MFDSRLGRLTKPRLFRLLMAVALLVFVMPRRWTDGLKSVSQMAVPGQYLLYSSSSKLGEALDRVADPPVPQDTHRRLQAENEQLASRLLAIEAEKRDLRRRYEQLAGLREMASLRTPRLIPARIVAADVVAWRDQLVVDQGRRRGVSRRDWVITHRFLDAGEDQGVRPGLSVLAGEYLIGWVDQVRPFVSRVRLFTDPAEDATLIRVRIGRLRDANVVSITEEDFVLKPAPDRAMHVIDVERSQWDEGAIHPGDVVLSSPNESALPSSVMIGEIKAMTRQGQDNELLCELVVDWPFDWVSIREVYIVANALP